MLSSLGIIFNPAVYAHTTTSNDNMFKIFIPDLRQGFEFSLTALALKPGASNLNYVIYNKGLPLQSPSWTEKEISPGFDAGFGLSAACIFPEGKDINLDWTHLNSSSSSSISAPNTNFFLGPDYEIGPAGIPIRHATGDAQFKYDVINLDAGQFIDIGRHVEMHFFAGLSNAYLREQVNATYTGNTLVGLYQGPFSTKQEVTANFTGIGPRLGVEFDYMSDVGMGILAKGAASALIGSSYAKTAYISSAQELKVKYGQNTNYQTIEDSNLYRVIPGFDAKLGVFYKRTLGNCSLLKLEGGYQAAVYINAINQYLPASLVPGTPFETGSIFVETMSHTQSNYSVQGPYLTVAVQF